MGVSFANKPPTDMPSSLTRQQCRQIIRDTNKMLNCHREHLSIQMRINQFGQYHEKTWHLSKARTTVKPYSPQPARGKNEPEKIVLQLEQVFRIHKMLKGLGAVEEPLMQTPSMVGEQSEAECCICMAKAPSVVLPCMHSYCDICTSQYIIEKDEKKCPQCRTQFAGSRMTIKRSCYELFNEDKSLYEQPRTILIQQIAVKNPNVSSWLIKQLNQQH